MPPPSSSSLSSKWTWTPTLPSLPPPLQLITSSNPEKRSARRESRRASDVSKEIDRMLARERGERTRARAGDVVRILLLGQAESGKSTTLKAFKLQYAPRQFEAEEVFWTMVILLNLVEGVRGLLECVGGGDEGDNDPLRSLRTRLAHLKDVEEELRRKICPDDLMSTSTSKFHIPSRTLHHHLSYPSSSSHSKASHSKPLTLQKTIQDSLPAMQDLWTHPLVRMFFKTKAGSTSRELEEECGFFLNDMKRIGSVGYRPSAEDILRARLKTTGVVEHLIQVEKGKDLGRQWLFIDVGGARTQRTKWDSFFNDVHCIIFLAPVDTFNRQLEEDRNVNRLEDTMLLWRSICTNKLLARVQLILFLNKVDILEDKLSNGIEFKKYVTSYNGLNKTEDVVSYLANRFILLHQQYSVVPRRLFKYATSVIDRQATTRVLEKVHSVIFENAVREASLM